MADYTGLVVRPDEKTLLIRAGGVIDIEAGAIIKAAGTQAAAIADLGVEATGTQIATAVNAIIAALEGAGIVALPEG